MYYLYVYVYIFQLKNKKGRRKMGKIFNMKCSEEDI